MAKPSIKGMVKGAHAGARLGAPKPTPQATVKASIKPMKASAGAGVTGPVRKRILDRRCNHVRTEVQAELVKSGRYDWNGARYLTENLSNEEILGQAQKAGFSMDEDINSSKVGALGDGKILQWIIDHKDQILELIRAIVSIFLAFSAPISEPEAVVEAPVATPESDVPASESVDASPPE